MPNVAASGTPSRPLDGVRVIDLFVHNVRPAAMSRLGLDYADLAAVNVRLIYLALVGFDQRGPYAPLVIVDRVCAVNAAQAALAALYMRERTGRGQYVEIPMFETAAQIVLGDHMGGETFDPPAGPTGYPRLLTPDRRPYRTKDGHVALLVYTDGQWQRFFEAIGTPEVFTNDARLTTAAMRAKHYDFAYAMLSGILLQRPSAEWVELLQRFDIPCMPLHDPHSLIGDPHLEAIGFFQMIDHPTEGRMRAMRVAARWSDADLSIRRHAPQLGEQSVEILRENNFDEARIERLLAGGAVIQHPPAV